MRALIFYFQMFTAIPINIEIKDPVQVFRRGVYLFSVFGLLFGLLMAGIYSGLRLFLSSDLAWLVTIVVDTVVTAGFHYDALADTGDGLWSARTPERMREIMQDSRIGSNGALALICYYLLQWGLMGAALDQQVGRFGEVRLILGLYVVSRSALCALFQNYRYLSHKSQGMGSIIQGIERWRIGVAQGLALCFIYVSVGLQALAAYLLVLVFVSYYRQFIYRRVGGLSGDTTGALALISQPVWLLLYLALTYYWH